MLSLHDKDVEKTKPPWKEMERSRLKNLLE